MDHEAGPESGARAWQFFRRALGQLIEAVKHEARLSQPIRDKQGKSLGTQRDHLLVAAQRGGKSGRAAQLLLVGPPAPAALEYLRTWAYELLGRSGGGMDGMNPLDPRSIESWASLTHREPNALEVEALFRLDAAIRHPDPEKDR